MYIRKAIEQDKISIIRSLQNKHIDYITTFHAKEDIKNNRLFVMIENDKIIAQCVLFEEKNYNYYAIKRLCVYNKKNNGHGIANQFINYFINNIKGNLGCTPWEDNKIMRHLLEKNGFIYQYTFLKNYTFYLKSKEYV